MGNSIPKISFRLLRGRYLLFFGWQNRYNRTLMWRTFCFCAIAALAGAAAAGAQLVLPSDALERSGIVHAIFRTGPLATGSGTFSMEWSDVYGRVVDRRSVPVELNDETDIGFDIDLRRAVAMKNEIRAHLVFDGQDKKGRKDHRDEVAQIAFIAKPPVHTWWDYNIIMWQNYGPELFAKLKGLGINGGQYIGRNVTPPEFLLKNDLRWYAENIATDFYSPYHRYYPDRDNGWEFKQARQAHQMEPASLQPFKRHPSLTDAEWLKRIHDRLIASAQFFSPYRPFFYSLGDETGIAELEAAWDFDFSDESIVPMREWLRQRYGTLAALNRQWGTQFASWSAVMPMTTEEAMKRSDDNFSAWADFKEWMDICYARALKMGTDAIHSVDPEAYVGIGGGQMPGWGGYDYSRITQSLTAVEPYDIGSNIEIIRSLNPKMAVLTTAFAHGLWEKQRVWYELLHGNRGLILWDDKSEYLDKNGNVEERGKEAESLYNELRNGIGALLISSRRQADPIAIHYSQPSLRVEWLLESKPRGGAWATRSAKAERTENDFMRLRESWCRVIEDTGLQYNFVSYGQVEQGELIRGGYRIMILPRSSALSAAEATAIHEFVAQGGTVVADGDAGTFDEHGRRLPQSQLADVFGNVSTDGVTGHAFGRGKAISLKANVLDYHRDRVVGKGSETRKLVAGILQSAGLRPAFAVIDEQGQPVSGVETHIFRNGAVTIVSLLNNPELRVDELGPPDFRSNERFAQRRSLKLVLPETLAVYDVRRNKALGRKRELMVELDPYEPVIYATSMEPLPEITIAAPARVNRGETGRIGIAVAGITPAAVHVLHVEVRDPANHLVPCYSGNLRAPGGHATWELPIAYNDAAGTWKVQVHDLLSGTIQTAAIEVF
jgi:hypothetical protein